METTTILYQQLLANVSDFLATVRCTTKQGNTDQQKVHSKFLTSILLGGGHIEWDLPNSVNIVCDINLGIAKSSVYAYTGRFKTLSTKLLHEREEVMP